jgi:hypothetical protein
MPNYIKETEGVENHFMRLYIMNKERRKRAFTRSFIYLFIHSKLQAEYVLPHRHLHISSSKNKQLHKIQLLYHHSTGAGAYNELLVNQLECQCRTVSSLPAMFIIFFSHGCRKSVITSRTRFLALCVRISRLIPLKEGIDLRPNADRRGAAPFVTSLRRPRKYIARWIFRCC